MDFAYTPEQELFRKEVTAFARATLNAGMIERDRGQAFSREHWRACGQMGLLGLPAPERYGGGGLDPLSCAIALEALGYGCTDHGLVFSVCAHLMTSVVALSKFGTDDQRRRYLPGLCDGTLIGVHAMTEADAGSDPFAMRTRAVPDGDTWRITGAKTFVSNGPEADVIVVFAVTDPETRYHGGVTAFILDRATPGVSAGRKIEKMGLRTSPFGELVFDEVQVSAEAVIGGVGGGAGVFTHAMDWERICLFASHVGQMERLTEQAVDYARTRASGGKTIGKYQAVSHRIADMKVRVEAARWLTYHAASQIGKTRAVSLDAAVTKLFVSEALVETARDAVQIFGGYGYTTEYQIERALRDAVSATIYSGTSEVQRSIIAAWLGL
jgi:alkylation response protein AidB-like acyl-CoA dehydrogenase